ncbi:G-type lectin S-receptor-like serine/threonine-protein kinase At4g03230 isoform X2 [Cajanus cajan]|uniref:G-type lectin S-receptor-like serine/threonine-protein kinase At4g03230 isoform X2 n=1 Tax=Cajanus cajan TaxID=3821 RepID=UPI0010FAD5A6|nr:G-type lectin S-receptor-like serine/threonine-protein kinase At4g03230 isoform X2 [Cajanus cajan]
MTANKWFKSHRNKCYLVLDMRSDEVLFFVLLFWSQLCSARDTLNAGQTITQHSAALNLVSSKLTFELGFFSLSVKTYLGIWYHGLEPLTVVWVANRDNPVEDSSGVFRISEDGNLVVESAAGSYHWSSQLELSSSTNRTVVLLDSGNLVLMDDDSNMLWQSFRNPTDTFLPGMKMDANLTLSSWRDAADPARGDFTFKLDGTQNMVVEKESKLYWAFDRLDVDTEAISLLIFNLLEKATGVTISYNISKKTVFESPPYNYSNSRLLMNSSGEIQFLKWNQEELQWDKRWSGPSDKCDIHDYCGSFGICNKNNEIRCKCLPGFSPNHDPHDDGEFKIQGCVRKSTSCIHNTEVMFLNLTNMKVAEPGQEFYTETEAECQSLCLNTTNKCPKSQCQAYSYNESTYGDRGDFTCKIWTRNLSTLLEDYDHGLDLSILVKASDIEPSAKWCEPCGTYVIPYPLSTAPNCGDPMYNKFNCSKSTGQVSFLMPGGTSQPVTRIDEDTRMFYIQTDASYSCSSIYQNDTLNFPFNVADCLQDVGIVKMSWLPAPEPPCSKLIDCNNWPHSTCKPSSQGGTRCLCDSNYKWNHSFMTCTQEEPPRNHSTKRMPLILTLTLGMAIVSCIIAFSIVQRKKKAKLDRESTRIQESLDESERHVKGLIGLRSLGEKDIEGIEVPCYTFASILAATNNFSDSNKLGRGGYGPVYKGRFPGGQDIAVKRLSSASTQGLREFKNEVILIAKLQHRNLVRLRGYCIEGDEKILLYEYMPNKSLDSFIFGTLLLDWPMRFEIIVGIARGMLYLHQDSRLRVIHRDLKTSNILLDEEMNPKISDFGLAKIFGGKETGASTERVVGTYGYMSPEYALDGHFSIKSDVFSFGVVLLEILSGERNTGFYRCEEICSLLGYAWKLWTENKLVNLMDPCLGGTCNENQFIKCALIGLLCIQDEPGDRPTMSNVLSMLDMETTTLPIPTQPTFFVNKRLFSVSANEMEISLQFDSSYGEGR